MFLYNTTGIHCLGGYPIVSVSAEFAIASLAPDILAFGGVPSGDGNPAQGTLFYNQVRPINIIKAYCCIRMSGAGVVSSYDGCNVSSVAISGAMFVITIATMQSTDYTVQLSGNINLGAFHVTPREVIASRTTTHIYVEMVSTGNVVYDPAAYTMDGVNVTVLGRQ